MNTSKVPQQIEINEFDVHGLTGLMEELDTKSRATAHRIKKQIPHLQIGRSIRFRKADIQKFLEKNFKTVE
jgi:hypothetical protein